MLPANLTKFCSQDDIKQQDRCTFWPSIDFLLFASAAMRGKEQQHQRDGRRDIVRHLPATPGNSPACWLPVPVNARDYRCFEVSPPTTKVSRGQKSCLIRKRREVSAAVQQPPAPSIFNIQSVTRNWRSSPMILVGLPPCALMMRRRNSAKVQDLHRCVVQRRLLLCCNSASLLLQPSGRLRCQMRDRSSCRPVSPLCQQYFFSVSVPAHNTMTREHPQKDDTRGYAPAKASFLACESGIRGSKAFEDVRGNVFSERSSAHHQQCVMG